MRRSYLRYRPALNTPNTYYNDPDITLTFGYQHIDTAFFDVVRYHNYYYPPLLILRVNEEK